MMADQRASGVDDEQLKKMITKEGFEKYKKVSAPRIIRTLKSSLVLEEIARKESITCSEVDVEDQLNLARQRADQQNEEFDEPRMKESIEATLKREAVLDFVANKLNIKFIEVETFTNV